ncbi:MAG: hypothetical protein IKT58_03565 [Oscillospiraceae bacterium]|nr:hypothetical protein [Oscillospiraceae bacterium]
MKNRIFSLLIVFLLLCTLILQVTAFERPDLTRPCSIELRLNYDGDPITDGLFLCLRVGYIEERSGQLNYRRVMDDQLILDITDKNLPSEMEKLAQHYELTGQQARPDQDGVVSFTDLEQGVYLILQAETSSGFHPIAPLLVTLPYNDRGTYVYDLDASVKSELDKEPEPPTEPTEPTKPTEPTEPTQPTQPTQPTKPTEPTRPTGPTRPTEPTEPTEPDEEAPDMGQLKWPVCFLAVMGSGTVLMGALLFFRRKKEEE